MKVVAAVLLLICSGVSLAQIDVHDWTNVQNISPNSRIWIKTSSGRTTGEFQSADDTELRVLTYRRGFLGGRRPLTLRLRKEEVREVRFSKPIASAIAGTAIGLAAGTAAGLALEAQYPNHVEDGHLAAAVFGGLGALFGELVGEKTAFIRGPKIYVAP